MSIETNGSKLTGPLNAMQIAVVRRLAAGKTHKAIAAELGYSRVTVSDNARVAARKLGCANSAELMYTVGQQDAYYRVARELDKIAYEDRHDVVGTVLTEFSARLRVFAAALRGNRSDDGGA